MNNEQRDDTTQYEYFGTHINLKIKQRVIGCA